MSNIQTEETSGQRLQNLQKLSTAYHGSHGVLEFLLQVEKPREISWDIEPITFTRGDDRMGKVTPEYSQFLQTQIEEACKNANSFLVISPEFSLYSRADTAEPITFDNQGNILSGQESVVEAFKRTQEMAMKYKKTIILSSICEKRILRNGTSALFNSTAIILPTGEVQFRRKTSEIFTQNDNGWQDRRLEVRNSINNNPDIKEENGDIDEIIELTLGSLRPIEIQDNKGNKLNIAVIVCQERVERAIYDTLPESIDLLVIPVSEGSLSTNKDIAAVTAYGESTFIRDQLGDQFNGKTISIAITNERTNKASVITYDGDRNITNISLR